jgi:hypothetical protein
MPADSRSRSSSPYAVEQMAVSMHRSVLGAWWRWRSEFASFLLAAGSFGFGWWGSGSWLLPLLILGAVALVLAVVPRPRRSLLLARFWVLFTRHRLQRSFWELRLHTRAGRLPLVLWISPTGVGVRAWVLLRAGMTFDDFEDSAAAFAAACGAMGCRVTASDRWAWLLSIDVIREDALGPVLIRSPLADLPDLGTDASAWPEPSLLEEQP